MKLQRLSSLALAGLLGGCATLSEEAVFAPVTKGVQQHTGVALPAPARGAENDAATAQRVAALLASPLDADAAVQLALIHHRGLQAALAGLGVARADWQQAWALPNPALAVLRQNQGGDISIERALHVNLSGLLLSPWVSSRAAALHQQHLQRVQGEVLAQALVHAAETRRAWVAAVASAQLQRYAQQVMQAAEASAELARRMAQVGNFNALSRAREQAFYADAALGLARAQMQATASRERLARQLGVWGEQLAFQLPERLPDLPAAARELPDIERRAIAERLDVAAARAQAEQLATSLGLTRTSRFINVLELELARESGPHGERARSVELKLELPIFDSGQPRLARAEALHHQALHRVAEVAINARSEAREAYAVYRGAYDIARHHLDEIVPLRARIAEENLLRYNGMLIGVFELLADARQQTTSVAAAIEAQRDFWLAHIELDAVLLGRPSAVAMPAAAASSLSSTAAPSGAGH